MTISREKKQKVAWIARIPPEEYAEKIHSLHVTVAEALEVMSTVMEMNYAYKERVVREMIKLGERERYSMAGWAMEG